MKNNYAVAFVMFSVITHTVFATPTCCSNCGNKVKKIITIQCKSGCEKFVPITDIID